MSKQQVVLTKWGIQYKNSKFNLTGAVYGHKRLKDGSNLRRTRRIVNAAVDYGTREIRFETFNTVYSCSFDEYTAKYLNEGADHWKEGAASPKVFDDVIKQLFDKNSKLNEAVTSGMIGTIVGDLKKQMEAAGDAVINLDEVMQNQLNESNSEGVKTLKRQLGEDIIISATWAEVKNKRELPNDELLSGELSAVTYEIGRYTVRSGQRVYKELADYTEEPFTGHEYEVLKEYEEQKKRERDQGLIAILPFFGMDDKVTVKEEISAIPTVDLKKSYSDGYRLICRATHTRFRGIWRENITFIGAVLISPASLKENEVLFVCNSYMGDSFGSDTWYRLNPSRLLNTYPSGAYGLEVPWNDNNMKAAPYLS